jgi:hypothetical protein
MATLKVVPVHPGTSPVRDSLANPISVETTLEVVS